VTEVCNDYGGNPACLKDADPRYTMDYTDVEDGGYIYWCGHCGPIAHSMEKAINERFAEDPDFHGEFKAAVEAAKASQENH
jgi:hypothetical protein